ncbi:hypothetical protein D3C75_717910 [compost metagenome]
MHDHHQVATVLGRDEALGRGHHQVSGGGDQYGIYGQHQRRPGNQAADAAGIAVGKPGKAPVERFGSAPRQARQAGTQRRMATVTAQDHRRQRRRQGQRVEQRNGRGHRDGHAELAEELAGNPRDERRGNEHRTEHQGNRHQRTANLLHGDDGRLYRALALAQVALDVLHHDDGVVDHDPYRQHQAEQGQVVDRVTQQRHHREGTHQ